MILVTLVLLFLLEQQHLTETLKQPVPDDEEHKDDDGKHSCNGPIKSWKEMALGHFCAALSKLFRAIRLQKTLTRVCGEVMEAKNQEDVDSDNRTSIYKMNAYSLLPIFRV